MPPVNPPGPRHRSVLAAAAALLAAAGALASCASSAATQDDGSPEADRRFYEARCGVCHVPFAKTNFPPAEWPAVVARFAPRAGLTTAQRGRVLRYLTSE